MDGRRFDTLTRGLADSTISRRTALRRLIGSGAGALAGLAGLRGATAQTCREIGRLCTKNANCCSNRCDTTNPDPALRNRCACPPDKPDNCRGQCKTAADYQTDVANCGGCGRRFPAPANGASVCVDGSCGLVCNPGYHQCGSFCRSNADPASCGASCTPCPVPANGFATGGSSLG